MALKQLTHAPTGRLFTETGTWRVPHYGEWFASKLGGGPVKMLASPGVRCSARHILREVRELEAVEGRQHSNRRGVTYEETGEVRAPLQGDLYLGVFGDQAWPTTCLEPGRLGDDLKGEDRIILRRIERPARWLTLSTAGEPEPHIIAKIGGRYWQTPSAKPALVGPETRARQAEEALENVSRSEQTAWKLAHKYSAGEDAAKATADAALERCAELEDDLERAAGWRDRFARAYWRSRTDYMNAYGEARRNARERDQADEACDSWARKFVEVAAAANTAEGQRDRIRENAQVIAGELYRMMLAYEQAQAGRVTAEQRVRELEGELADLAQDCQDAEDALTDGIRDDLAAGGLL